MAQTLRINLHLNVGVAHANFNRGLGAAQAPQTGLGELSGGPPFTPQNICCWEGHRVTTGEEGISQNTLFPSSFWICQVTTFTRVGSAFAHRKELLAMLAGLFVKAHTHRGCRCTPVQYILKDKHFHPCYCAQMPSKVSLF